MRKPGELFQHAEPLFLLQKEGLGQEGQSHLRAERSSYRPCGKTGKSACRNLADVPGDIHQEKNPGQLHRVGVTAEHRCPIKPITPIRRGRLAGYGGTQNTSSAASRP